METIPQSSGLTQQDFYGEYYEEDFTTENSMLIEQDTEPVILEDLEDAMEIDTEARGEDIVSEADDSDLESNIDVFKYVYPVSV